MFEYLVIFFFEMQCHLVYIKSTAYVKTRFMAKLHPKMSQFTVVKIRFFFAVEGNLRWIFVWLITTMMP